MIHLENISKTFKVAKRASGTRNAIKSFFKRNYTTINALNDISFDIDEGEIVGYIGPNGAGKSTTIKIMCGILVPTDGKCIINGRIPWEDRIKHVKDIRSCFWTTISIMVGCTARRFISIIKRYL
jgi:ABC-2 type transport system ATP-binding protein